MRLGWRTPRANTFKGPDAAELKSTFGDVQRFMTWPHIGLVFDGTFAMSTTFTSSIVPMTVIPGPPTDGDPYSLYRSTTVHVQAPRDFTHWMMFGAANFRTGGDATPPLRSLGFTINGAVTEEWVTHAEPVGAGGSRAVVPIMERVKKGDVINVCAAVSATPEDLAHARAWLVFLPLA